MEQRTSRAIVSGILAAAVTALAVTLGTIALTERTTKFQSSTQAAGSDYDRILKRGTIRCGYVSNPPSSIIDPNTGKVSGIFAEAIERVASDLGLKIEWKEEVGFGQMIEGLLSDRYDMVPCAIWPNTARAKQVDFGTPLFFSGVGVYARKDDDRFTNDLSAINSPNVKIATMDGEMAATIVRNDFPQAQRVELPQLSEITTMLLNVQQKKADVTFVEPYFAYKYIQSNPNSLKRIDKRPIRLFPNTAMIRRNQYELKAMIDTALRELVYTGIADSLINKYEPEPGIFYRLNPPLRMAPSEARPEPR